MRDWLGEAKAKQVYLVLRDRILTDAIAFGAKLPTENELAEVHGVSRVGARRALAELARERLIKRRPSAGTQVIYRAPMIADISGILASLVGRRTTVQLTSIDYMPAAGTVALALGVPSDQMLQRSVRVRLVDGEPTSTQQERAWRPLLDLLERAGVKVEHARQRISAGLAAADIAAALSVRTGAPRIELTRLVYDQAAVQSSSCMRCAGRTARPSQSTSSARARKIGRGRHCVPVEQG